LNEKEKKVYKDMEVKKDDIDSAHLWAGNIIKQRQGNTKFNFLGNLRRAS